MNTNAICYFIFLLISFTLFDRKGSQAQPPNWNVIAHFNSPGVDDINDLTKDSAGYTYLLHSLQDSLDVDPGPGVVLYTAYGDKDVLLSKIDPAGNLVWARQLGCPGLASGSAIALDASGNICIAGRFYNGSIDMNPDSSVSDSLFLSGIMNGYVAKYDTAGNLLWARPLGGSSLAWIYIYSMCLNDSGDIFISGVFRDTIDFDPDTATSYTIAAYPSSYDIYVARLDDSGNFSWARRMGGADYESCTGMVLSRTASQDIYLTGLIRDSTDLDPDPGQNYYLSPVGGDDAYLVKLDNSGNFLWAKSFGSTGKDVGNAITPGDSGGVYLTGSFSLIADFDPGPAVYSMSASGAADIFVSKFDAQGIFQWAKSMGGTDSESGISIITDEHENIYIAGSYRSTVDFNPDQSVSYNLTSNGEADIFIVKLDPQGTFTWANAAGGSDNDAVSFIKSDGDGHIYLASYFFSDTIAFNWQILHDGSQATWQWDAALLRLDTSYIAGTFETKNIAADLRLFPNPATRELYIDYEFQPGKRILEFYNASGKLMMRSEVPTSSASPGNTQRMVLNVEGFPDGVYYARILSDQVVATKPFVIIH